VNLLATLLLLQSQLQALQRNLPVQLPLLRLRQPVVAKVVVPVVDPAHARPSDKFLGLCSHLCRPLRQPFLLLLLPRSKVAFFILWGLDKSSYAWN
jgi:hypothetical protein